MGNKEVLSAAAALFPGGVNSPVRSFRAVGGSPVPIARGEGAYVYDEDGARYIDYLSAFGPLILGHGNAAVVEAVADAARDGTAFGAITKAEVELGSLVTQAANLERVRFVSSGTEATMTAIRLARAATGRDVVVKFDGCYHGHADGLLVKAGSGLATLALSDSAGVPEQVAALTAVLPYNSVEALEAWFSEHGDETAAVIVEPVAGNMGVVQPAREFCDALQSLTRQHGALLIADEVITGFRLKYGLSDLLPDADLVCLGKVIGGGLPIGAFGGSAEIMGHVAPEGSMYQAGTLAGNPLVMAAGTAMLRQLESGAVYDRIGGLAGHLEQGLSAAARRAGVDCTVVRTGSMLSPFFMDSTPSNHEEVQRCDTEGFGVFHRAMRERGILLPPSQFETWFVSAAHTETEIDATVNAAHESFHIVAKARGDRG